MHEKFKKHYLAFRCIIYLYVINTNEYKEETIIINTF